MDLLSFANWFAIVLFGVAVTKLSLTKIYINDPKWWARFIIVHKDTKTDKCYLQISYDLMDTQQSFVNYNIIFHLSLITYAYGNIAERFPDPMTSLPYMIGYLLIPIFGFMGQIKGMEFSVVPNFFRHLSIQAKIVFVLLCWFLIEFLVYQIYLAYLANQLTLYLAGTFIIPAAYYFVYSYYISLPFVSLCRRYISESKRHSWHIHHWFIGLYLSYLARYNTPFSNTMFIAYFGVFLEGSMYYGATPII